MPRDVSDAFKAAAFGASTDEVVLELLTLYHADFGYLYLVRNTESIVSRGKTFLPAAFDLTWPQDREGEPPTAKIAHENISRELVAIIRSIRTPIAATLEVVLASDPNTVEAAYEGMNVIGNSYNAEVIEFDLSYERFMREPFPGRNFGPAKWKGLF